MSNKTEEVVFAIEAMDSMVKPGSLTIRDIPTGTKFTYIRKEGDARIAPDKDKKLPFLIWGSLTHATMRCTPYDLRKLTFGGKDYTEDWRHGEGILAKEFTVKSCKPLRLAHLGDVDVYPNMFYSGFAAISKLAADEKRPITTEEWNSMSKTPVLKDREKDYIRVIDIDKVIVTPRKGK
jgi:hypothetical protein